LDLPRSHFPNAFSENRTSEIFQIKLL
jgi:hypothetical protein